MESCPVSLTSTPALLAFPQMTINIYKECRIAGNGEEGAEVGKGGWGLHTQKMTGSGLGLVMAELLMTSL